MSDDFIEDLSNRCSQLFSFNLSSFRHTFGSFLSGALVAAAWLIFIDGALVAAKFEDYRPMPWYLYLLGFVQTFVFFLINIANFDYFGGAKEDSLLLNDERQTKIVRVWLFIMSLIGVGVIVASVWLSIEHYKDEGNKIWPCFAVGIQNVLILISAFLFLVARKTEEDEESAPLM
eukprot:TRINITY_DN3664_c0_g1_i1.p1 TRINITY_DN3664_c0_g1~~TRINITY_DN3664_c0_g1_i1.p1  ORF type:complete len:175 (-),score=15.32 TRINITY_DN3664_c0_g1_i1:44-568(-)